MITYDVECPMFGVINWSLFQEETDSCMECESYVPRKYLRSEYISEKKGVISLHNKNTLWRSKQINCHQFVTGYKGKGAIIRMTGNQCGAIVIRRIMSRRYEWIDMYAVSR